MRAEEIKKIIDDYYEDRYIHYLDIINPKHKAIVYCWNNGLPPQYLADKFNMRPQGIHYILDKYKK